MSMATPEPALFEMVELFPAERSILAKPEDLSPAQWAEKYIVISKGPWPGPFRLRRTPYLRGPLDLFSLPWTRDVVFMFGDQMGKSLFGRIVHEYSQARKAEAVGAIILPDEKSGETFIENNVKPILTKSPYLKSRLATSRAITSHKIRYRDGGYIDLAWSGSLTTLAHTGREFAHATEVDKWAGSAEEASPVEQLKVRARPYRTSYKFVWESTPSTEHGNIWGLINECSITYTLLVYCPYCGHLQPLAGDQLRYPEETSSTEIEDAGLGRFECARCEASWTDYDRDEAVSMGVWAPGRFDDLEWIELGLEEIPAEPKKIGFWLPAFASANVSLSQAAAAKASSESGESVDKKKAYYNKYLALPYVDQISDRSVDQILALKDSRPRGQFPAGGVALLGSVDVQHNGFFYVIRAYRPGLKLETHLVREGFCRTEEELREILQGSDYIDGNGEAHRVECAAIDAGDQTGKIYRMCYRWGGFLLAIKGGKGRRARPVSFTKKEIDPEKGRAIPGGLVLFTIDTHYFKDELAYMISDLPDSPPTFHLHSEVGRDYAKQMTAETKEGDLWDNPRKAPNHYWDCEVYNLALAEIRGVKFRPDPSKPRPQPKPKPKTQKPMERRYW